MLKRPYCWAFVIGAALLLAIVLMVRVQPADQPARAYQTLYVGQAVTHLQGGCLTCHSTLVNTTSLMTYAHPPDLELTSEAPLQRVIDTQLRDLGQRILALPDDTARQEEVEDVFLQTYDATRHIGADPQTVQKQTVRRIHSLERLLQKVINQVSPYRVSRQDTVCFEPDSTALHSSVPASPARAALSQGLAVGDILIMYGTMYDTDPFVMPLERVFAVHRRGPPMGLASDSG